MKSADPLEAGNRSIAVNGNLLEWIQATAARKPAKKKPHRPQGDAAKYKILRPMRQRWEFAGRKAKVGRAMHKPLGDFGLP